MQNSMLKRIGVTAFSSPQPSERGINRVASSGGGARTTIKIPYSKQALQHDLSRLRRAWSDCQETRQRDAIYTYLSAVFELIAWWAAKGKAEPRAAWALRLRGVVVPDVIEPFAAVVFATANIDKRTRSKWSRALRYVADCKDLADPLEHFMKQAGGINKCAELFSKRLRRQQRKSRKR